MSEYIFKNIKRGDIFGTRSNDFVKFIDKVGNCFIFETEDGLRYDVAGDGLCHNTDEYELTDMDVIYRKEELEKIIGCKYEDVKRDFEPTEIHLQALELAKKEVVENCVDFDSTSMDQKLEKFHKGITSEVGFMGWFFDEMLKWMENYENSVEEGLSDLIKSDKEFYHVMKFKIKFDDENGKIEEMIVYRMHDNNGKKLSFVDENGKHLTTEGCLGFVKAIGQLMCGVRQFDEYRGWDLIEKNCDIEKLSDNVVIGLGIKKLSDCYDCGKQYHCKGCTKWEEDFDEKKCSGWEDDMSWTR